MQSVLRSLGEVEPSKKLLLKKNEKDILIVALFKPKINMYLARFLKGNHAQEHLFQNGMYKFIINAVQSF